MSYEGTLLMSGAVVRWPVPAILVTREDAAIPYRLAGKGTMMTETRRCCCTSDGPCECVCHANDAADHPSLCDCTPTQTCGACREVEARYGLAPIGGGSDEADAPVEQWPLKWIVRHHQQMHPGGFLQCAADDCRRWLATHHRGPATAPIGGGE